jgi:hypothetical protein
VASALERDGRWALVAAVTAYGVNSAIDWTWYFPGVVVPALVAAGWISGLASAVAPAAAAPRGAETRESAVGPEPVYRRPLSRRPGAILALTGITVTALALCWGIWQPLRSTDDINAAGNALASLNGGAALADARAAVSADPLSVAPLETLSAVDQATRDQAAGEAELVRATTLQPQNPQPFWALGSYLLCRGRYSAALGPLQRTAALDVTDSLKQQMLITYAQDRSRPPSVCGGGT